MLIFNRAWFVQLVPGDAPLTDHALIVLSIMRKHGCGSTISSMLARTHGTHA